MSSGTNHPLVRPHFSGQKKERKKEIRPSLFPHTTAHTPQRERPTTASRPPFATKAPVQGGVLPRELLSCDERGLRLVAPPPRHRGKDPHPPPCCRHQQPSIQSLVPFSTQGWQPAGVTAAMQAIVVCQCSSMTRDANQPPDWPSEAPLALRMASPGALFAFLGAPAVAAASRGTRHGRGA